MAIKISPYIHLNGNAEQAIRLYERALDAKVEALMRYAEMPGATFAAEQKKLVMHAELRIGEGALMIADAVPGQPPAPDSKGQVLLTFTDLSEMRKKFDALAADGKVDLALHDTFWGATFGVLTDAFGIHWMFNCEKQG